MGNESSKQEVVEPPPEWDPTSNAKKFELVSPMSDLSNPSMFLHRRPHPKLSDATVQQIAGQKHPQQHLQQRHGREPPARLATDLEHSRKGAAAPARQTPAGDRRRKSKVIATRDSAHKHESRARDLPPPTAFYFPTAPTQESEDSQNRMSIRRSSSTGGIAKRQSNESSENNNKSSVDRTASNKENSNNRNRKNTPLLLKAKRRVNKARTCLTGCFEESNNKVQLMKDNANMQRGQRLSSEIGGAKISQVEARGSSKGEEPSGNFDPYKSKPLTEKSPATVLQFIDGQEKQLSFNPVWRESHDGTYPDASTTTGTAARVSTSTSNSTEQRRLSDRTNNSDSNTRKPIEYSKRVSDPPSRMRDSLSTSKTAEEGPIDSDAVLEEVVLEKAASRDGENDQSKPRNEFETTSSNQESGFVRETTNNNTNLRESLSSAATSHESSYWNGYYKEAQVLHHEDSYFDRIMYKRPSSASMPDPSPMANDMAATPAMDFFGQDVSKKSLLGNMAGSPESVDEMSQENLLSKASVASQSTTADKNKVEGTKDDANAKREKESEVTSTDGHDVAHKSSVMGLSSNTFENIDEHGFALIQKQPSDEEVDNAHDRPMDEPPTYSQSIDQFDDLDFHKPARHSLPGDATGKEAPRASFLDRRISADQVLVQTFQTKRITKNPSSNQNSQPVLAADTTQETPTAALVEKRESFGSAFSYRDKDVFTPVTSSTTYPRGSPFRPRLNEQETKMAKARLSQPSMFTQSLDNMSRSSYDMQVHASQSAPSMIEAHDYRDIAYGCFLEDTPSTLANKKERALALRSSSAEAMESPMSAAMTSPSPLLSDQVLNNAAFLFSPSYAGANSLLQNGNQAAIVPVEHEEKRQSRMSISTLGSRSRVSIRSQKSIRIPASKGRSSISPDKTVASKKSMSTMASQKSVRFSDGYAPVAVESDTASQKSETASQKSRRSVKWDFSLTAAPEAVDIPAIETKVSDLSDTVFGGRESLESVRSEKRQSIDSIKLKPSQEVIEEETASLPASEHVSRPSLLSTGFTRESSEEFSQSGTPEEQIRTWSYCEFSKGVTPMLDKKLLAHATNSPVLRFKAAKNKFVARQEKTLPAKKTSPSFYVKATGKGRVHMLASKFDSGTKFCMPTSPVAPVEDSHVVAANAEIASAHAGATSGKDTRISGDRKMLRTPQILGYTAKSHPNIYQLGSRSFDSDAKSRLSGVLTAPTYYGKHKVASAPAAAPFDEVPDDETSVESNDSTYVQSVATVKQEGRDAVRNNNATTIEDDDKALDKVLDDILELSESSVSHSALVVKASEEDRDDLPSDEKAEDEFAEILLDDLLSGSKDDVSAPRQTSSRQLQQLRSTVSSDEDDENESTFTNIMATVPSFDSQSSGTTMSTTLLHAPKLRYGQTTVKPYSQKQHTHSNAQNAPASSDLFLSPNVRTSVESQKWRQGSLWRQLAEKAQNQPDSKKNIFRGGGKKKPGRLSERDLNVV